MQIDCFLCSTKDLSDERFYFQEITFASLFNQKGISVPQMLYKPMLLRYYEAERRAQTPYYVVCDNDIVLATNDTLIKAIKILEKNPEYSHLGLGWRFDMQEERKSSWKTGENGEIWDFKSVGGCIVFRRGTIKDIGLKMEFENYGDDRVIGETARQLGYKVGVIPDLTFIHLGGKHSSFYDKGE